MTEIEAKIDELGYRWRTTVGIYKFPGHVPRPGLQVRYWVLAADRMSVYSKVGMLCDLQVAHFADPQAAIYWNVYVGQVPTEEDLAEELKPWWKRLWEKWFGMPDACMRRYTVGKL